MRSLAIQVDLAHRQAGKLPLSEAGEQYGLVHEDALAAEPVLFGKASEKT